MKYLLTLIFISSYLFAQAPNANWVKVLELSDQTVFVDTSNIKKFDVQISALGLYIYPKPQTITEINKDASSAKARILFNQELKNYTIIGTLYYDTNWKIIGETTLQTYTLGNISVGQPIDSNKVILAIYNKCIQLLDSINTIPKKVDLQKTKTENKKVEIPVKNFEIKSVPKDSVKTQKADRDLLTEKFIDKKLNEDSKIPITLKKETTTSAVPPTETRKSKQDYSVSSERNVKGMIFTDGKQFCFQVSSWKIKSQADREVEKMKSRGHNAFITEAYLPNRGGTWYRVRIGYFNSQEETESYQKRMR